MNDLSNTAIIGAFISMLLGTIGVIWGLYLKEKNKRAEERIQFTEKLLEAANKLNLEQKEYQEKQLAASDKALQEQKEHFEKQTEYQQQLINSQKIDNDNLNAKYFELGSTLYPLVKETKATIEGLGEILKKM